MLLSRLSVLLVLAGTCLCTEPLNGGAEYAREHGESFNSEVKQFFPKEPTPTPTEDPSLYDKVQALAKSRAPASRSVVDRELGELHSLLGNYKAVHETKKVHSYVKHVLDYKPDGMPLNAATKEDRVLRDLRRTAEVVRKAGDAVRKARRGVTVGLPTAGEVHHPEPETLDPSKEMEKKAYDNLPVRHKQEDVKAASTIDNTKEEEVPAQPKEEAVKETLVQGASKISHDDEDTVLPADDGILAGPMH